VECRERLDADSGTGWAIAPAMGYSHQAVFEFGQPISHEGTSHLLAQAELGFSG
jgi:hypothetical protein